MRRAWRRGARPPRRRAAGRGPVRGARVGAVRATPETRHRPDREPEHRTPACSRLRSSESRLESRVWSAGPGSGATTKGLSTIDAACACRRDALARGHAARRSPGRPAGTGPAHLRHGEYSTVRPVRASEVRSDPLGWWRSQAAALVERPLPQPSSAPAVAAVERSTVACVCAWAAAGCTLY